MQFQSVQEFLAYAKIEIKANRLKLPTLPDIAMKIMDAVANGNATAQQIADYIATDPVLSARLIQVANSPLYRSNQEIKNIQTAVIRLGNNTTRILVTSLAMQQMFSPKSELLEHYFRDIWTQSVNISAICRSISQFVPHLDREEAMLAGLIHQIGKLPILILAETLPEFRESPSKMEKLLEVAHPHMGKLIMDNWIFPAELKPATYEYAIFDRETGNKADYVDIVQIAFLLNAAETDHRAALIDLKTVPAFKKLGLEPSIEILTIEGIPEEIELTLSTFF